MTLLKFMIAALISVSVASLGWAQEGGGEDWNAGETTEAPTGDGGAATAPPGGGSGASEPEKPKMKEVKEKKEKKEKKHKKEKKAKKEKKKHHSEDAG
ncbi:MAG: hypothetical protein IPL83_05215 [Bdellovibrionales bacterium]|nr:hypothetical protein [Bdellovibrionales bacterium]